MELKQALVDILQKVRPTVNGELLEKIDDALPRLQICSIFETPESRPNFISVHITSSPTKGKKMLYYDLQGLRRWGGTFPESEIEKARHDLEAEINSDKPRLNNYTWKTMTRDFFASKESEGLSPNTIISLKGSIGHFERLVGTPTARDLNLALLEKFKHLRSKEAYIRSTSLSDKINKRIDKLKAIIAPLQAGSFEYRYRMKELAKMEKRLAKASDTPLNKIPISRKTVNNNLIAIESFFNWLLERKYIANEITIKKFSIAENQVRVMSQAESDRLMEALKSYPKVNLPIQIMAATASRIGDVMKLRVDQIDFEGNIINFSDEKTGTFRAIPVRKELMDDIAIWMSKEMEVGQRWLFSKSDPTNKRSSAIFAYSTFSRILRKCQIKGVSTHEVRKTVLTWIARQYGIEAAITMSGHKDKATFIKYYYNTDYDLRQIVDTLPMRNSD